MKSFDLKRYFFDDEPISTMLIYGPAKEKISTIAAGNPINLILMNNCRINLTVKHILLFQNSYENQLSWSY